MARPFKKPEPKERRSKDQQLAEILLEISTKPEPEKERSIYRVQLSSGFVLR